MLYETDYVAWAEAQAKALAEGRVEDLDLANLADEVASLSGSDKSRIWNRASVLVAHLLKWQYQPGKRGNSWTYTIKEQRLRIKKLLKESPSLRPYLEAELEDIHEHAALLAAKDTGFTEHVFTDTRYTVEQLVDPAFYPKSLGE